MGVMAAAVSVGLALGAGARLAMPQAPAAARVPDPPAAESRPAARPSAPPQSSTSAAPEDGFYLRAYRGFIGLYRAGLNEPYDVVESPVAMLPAGDQEALARGVYAATEEELWRLIEDYTG